MEDCVTRLVLEYAQRVPPAPHAAHLSLRRDFAIESLSLVALALRLGDELGVDVAELGLELGRVDTISDLVKIGHTIASSRAQ